MASLLRTCLLLLNPKCQKKTFPWVLSDGPCARLHLSSRPRSCTSVLRYLEVHDRVLAARPSRRGVEGFCCLHNAPFPFEPNSIGAGWSCPPICHWSLAQAIGPGCVDVSRPPLVHPHPPHYPGSAHAGLIYPKSLLSPLLAVQLAPAPGRILLSFTPRLEAGSFGRCIPILML